MKAYIGMAVALRHREVGEGLVERPAPAESVVQGANE